MSALSLVLWALWFLACGWLLVRLVRFRLAGRMIPLVLYLMYSLVRTTALALIWIVAPKTYWTGYWLLQGGGYVLMIMLALWLATQMTCDVRTWICIGAVIVMVPWFVMADTGSWSTWLRVAMWSDIAVVFILGCGLLWNGGRWRWPREGIATGVVVGMGLHMACALVQSRLGGNPPEWLRLASQASGIAQVGVWCWTFRAGRMLTDRMHALREQ